MVFSVWYCLDYINWFEKTPPISGCCHSLCLDPARYRKRGNVLSTSMHASAHCSLVLIVHTIWPALLLWLLCHDGLESGTANQINPFPFKSLLLWCFTTVTEKKLRQYPKLVEGLGIGKGYCNLRSFSSNSGLLRSLDQMEVPTISSAKTSRASTESVPGCSIIPTLECSNLRVTKCQPRQSLNRKVFNQWRCPRDQQFSKYAMW